MDRGKKSHRNFITYVTGSDRDDRKFRVRVNCKFRPDESWITTPPDMEVMAKTTMVKYDGDEMWHIFEDRIEAKDGRYVKNKCVQYMCIFLQERRITRGSGVQVSGKKV